MSNDEFRRIYVENPLGKQFEAEIPCGTPIRKVAADFFFAQDWPTQDDQGRGVRAVVELVNPNNPDETKRLNANQDICEALPEDGYTLRIFPESITGGVRQIFIEGPSGDRFEAMMPCKTPIRKVVADFFDTQGWPMQDEQGRGIRAVVELVNPNNPDESKRLNGHQDICEALPEDGYTLRIFPESMDSDFRTIYVEDLSGKRFEVDIPCSMSIQMIGTGVLEAQGWPKQDNFGHRQSVVVELVNPNNPDENKRLNGDLNICETIPEDGHILHIFPEFIIEEVRKINIESPSGERFEKEVPCEMQLCKLAADFFEEQGWPKEDNQGRRQRTVVELVDRNNQDESKRLYSYLDIYEAGILDDDTLRIYPESMPEGITIYVESASGERFEAEVPCGTPLRKLAADFFEAQGWPMPDSKGHHAIVELVNPDNPDEAKRLDSDLDICEAGLLNGDTLRIYSGAVAGCFLSEVKVSLANGRKKAIRDIKVGDILLSGVPNTNLLTKATVLQVFTGISSSHLRLNNILRVTESHPIWTNRGWLRADELKIGDLLQDIFGHQIKLKSIERRNQETKVYNLYLSSLEHTFFAEEILVHHMDFKEAYKEFVTRLKKLFRVKIERLFALVKERLDDYRLKLAISEADGAKIGSHWTILSPDYKRTLAQVTIRSISDSSSEAESDAPLPSEVTTSCRAIEIQTVLINEPFDDVYVDIQLNLPSEPVFVGEEFQVSVSLRPGGRGEGVFCSLSIPKESLMGGEVDVFLEPQGVRVKGSKEDSLPLVPSLLESGEEVEPQALFTVSATHLGVVEIRVDVYFEGTFKESLVGEVWVSAADLGLIERRRKPRPVPQPDLMLQVASVWKEDGSAVRFRYRLDGFRGALLEMDGLSSPWLADGWLIEVRGLLGQTLNGMSYGSSADIQARLKSFGRFLYRNVLDVDLQKLFERAGSGYTLLIVADQEACLPWELLHDGRGFLGERFIIGRWAWESDDSRPYEFPIGPVSIAHYAGIDSPEMWAQLVKPPAEASPAPEILTGGVLDLKYVDRLRGLHLIRRAQLAKRDGSNLPVQIKESMREEVQKTRLSLRRNRPLVTLSYLGAGQAELIELAESWAPTYINAGCSAFIGPLWAVDTAVEAAFVSTFYAELWKGAALGQAFHRAQEMARVAVPERLDWLAYILFGDPMARAYHPVEGDGYAVVEPVGRQIEQPILPGESVRFRVSLRRTPPVWHEERVVEVAEKLDFEQLEVHVMARDVTILPDPVIVMQRTPTGDYLGWFTLLMPAKMKRKKTGVQVFFVDGEKTIHTLTIPLKVGR